MWLNDYSRRMHLDAWLGHLDCSQRIPLLIFHSRFCHKLLKGPQTIRSVMSSSWMLPCCIGTLPFLLSLKFPVMKYFFLKWSINFNLQIHETGTQSLGGSHKASRNLAPHLTQLTQEFRKVSPFSNTPWHYHINWVETKLFDFPWVLRF